ncbi:MAG: bacteriohemerythrin [Polyangiaceae bacterium]
MPIAIWSDEYLTGDVLVDEHHRQLFVLVNDLHEAIHDGRGRAALGPTLTKLWEYTAMHFAVEEQLMETAHYPDLDAHRSQHWEGRHLASGLMDRYRLGGTILPDSLSQDLARWIVRHICDHDRRMIQWLHARDAAYSTAMATADAKAGS